MGAAESGRGLKKFIHCHCWTLFQRSWLLLLLLLLLYLWWWWCDGRGILQWQVQPVSLFMISECVFALEAPLVTSRFRALVGPVVTVALVVVF